MSRIQIVVVTILAVFPSWSYASTSFLRSGHLYRATDTGGAEYVTSQVESTCGEYFLRRSELHRLGDLGYDHLVSGVTLAAPPFVLVGEALKEIDSANNVTDVAEDVDEIQYPYYTVDETLFIRSHGTSKEITDGVTSLQDGGFLKGDRGFILSGDRFEELGSGVTSIIYPYYLKGDSLYALENGRSTWVASGVKEVSPDGYFLRGDVVYEIETGGTYGYVLRGISQLLGNLALGDETLWLLSGDSPRRLADGVKEASEEYYLEGDRLYRMEGDTPVYVGAGVTQLPCSSGFALHF